MKKWSIVLGVVHGLYWLISFSAAFVWVYRSMEQGEELIVSIPYKLFISPGLWLGEKIFSVFEHCGINYAVVLDDLKYVFFLSLMASALAIGAFSWFLLHLVYTCYSRYYLAPKNERLIK